MAESLVPLSEGSIGSPDAKAIRSRVTSLSENRRYFFNCPNIISSEANQFLGDCILDFQNRMKQIEAEDSSIDVLTFEDLGKYVECLKAESQSIEDEDKKILAEINSLAAVITEDSAALDGELVCLDSKLELNNTQEIMGCPADTDDTGSVHGILQESPCNADKNNMFEILELDYQIMEKTSHLSFLMDTEHRFKSFEAIEHIEDMFSGIKVVDFEGNSIRLSLKTHITLQDSMLHQKKLSCLVEPFLVDHELLVEFIDGTMYLKNAKIFPSDVFLEEVIYAAKSMRHSLSWLVRHVQWKIFLCALGRLVVKDVNKSRYSIDYPDKDEILTAHLIGGVDAYIKIPHGWPISNCGFEIVSIIDNQLKSISLSLLCKIKERVNALDKRTRQDLTDFVDAVEEILVKEMQTELQTGRVCS